jgi:hypothetical protein
MSEDYKGKSVVESGAAIAGGVTGTVIGTLMAGSVGAVVGLLGGAAVGQVIEKGIVELTSRVLSTRQKFRAETTAKYAILKIQQFLNERHTPRNDDFFDKDETDRSKADELFEGVLLKAKNEPAEKKIRFLGNLFANVAFRADVPTTVANFLLSTAEALSYRQFCFIALLHQQGILNVENLRGRDHTILDLQILKREEWSLQPQDFGTFGLIEGSIEWEDWLTDMGDMFYDLLSLNAIPQQDIDEVSRLIDICETSPRGRGPTERVTPPKNKRKVNI